MMIMLIDFRLPKLPKVLTWCYVMRLNKINRVSRQLRKAGAHVVTEDYATNEMRIHFTVRDPAILDDMGLLK